MSVLSGRYGTINGIPAVRNWQIGKDGNLSRFVNSATAAGSGRKKGVGQWGGSYASHGGIPAVMPSEFFSFVGYTAPTSGVLGTVGQAYTGSAIVDALGINWNWVGGQVLEHQVSFGGHLALTSVPVNAAVLDATVSDPEAVGLTLIKYSADDGVTWTTLTDLTQASLQFQASNSQYVNSSTYSNTGRVPGPIDWSASIGVEANLLGHGLTQFNDYMWRFYVNATECYELKWGMVKAFSGLQVSPESGQVISHSINIEMSAAVDAALGHIKLPDASTWWPF